MGTIPTSPWYYLYDSVHLPRSERISAPAWRRQISLNEVYFGEFTFPGLGPSIAQAQFDLYGGGTAEAQQAISHFINFSLRVVLGDFWKSSPSLSFSLVFFFVLHL
ncbi:hypothetical protein PIB30_063295 [Stylosanthes scabra]|uniref:Uncharacterized protein n=1 Tax=Stylosanthes scabra TaxID=79078 RepID=A0ABU6YLX4_9FABA|nr:hypothetical protein [Stylosanthes scabra]